MKCRLLQLRRQCMTDCSDMARKIVLWRRTPYVILQCIQSRDAKSCVSRFKYLYIILRCIQSRDAKFCVSRFQFLYIILRCIQSRDAKSCVSRFQFLYIKLRCIQSRDAKSCVSQANNAYIFMVLLLLPCSDGLLVRRKILRLYRLTPL